MGVGVEGVGGGIRRWEEPGTWDLLLVHQSKESRQQPKKFVRFFSKPHLTRRRRAATNKEKRGKNFCFFIVFCFFFRFISSPTADIGSSLNSDTTAKKQNKTKEKPRPPIDKYQAPPHLFFSVSLSLSLSLSLDVEVIQWR